MPAKINAVSYFLPEKVYSNNDFFRDFPSAKGTNLEKVGVAKRHIASSSETSADLALFAAQILIHSYNIDISTIDFVLLGVMDPDHYLPASACIIQEKLGLRKNCGALDFNMGCSAYVYGLGLANGLVESGSAENVLLLTGSTLTKTFHPKDKSSKFVFGDAGSATLISSSSEKKIGPFVYGTDGKGFDKIIIRDGGARYPLNEKSHEELKDEFGNISANANFNMDGMGIFLFSVRTVPQMLNDLLVKAKLSQNDIDLFIFHQPNVFLNETIRKKMGIPEEKFVHCMKDFGNTVQATIPIAISESQKSGKLKPGMTVALAGFGVGLSWSACIVRF